MTAIGVPAADVLGALEAVGTTHVVCVPDTSQRTVLDLLEQRGTLPVIRAATEDDVAGICLGLWVAGARPVALIQQLGLFASANALRAMAHDQRAPLTVVAGLYGREVDRAVEDSAASAVRLCVPLLDALQIDHCLVEEPDRAAIEDGLRAAFDDERVFVVLLGAPTS
jgi:sulfopyruvate decarboxylase TPP-binding subunit